MFSRLFGASAAPADSKNDVEVPESDSASPPPPSESVPPTVAPAAPKPKPRKPRTSKKKAPADGEDAPDASHNGDADLKAATARIGGTDGTFKDLDGLRELIANVPPKTLHLFLKQRLDVQKARSGAGKKRPNANVFPTLENDYPIISAFFTGLAAPPRNHCVRCHQDYYDIDNGPRSCVKEHDDDSAVVKKGTGSVHRTFWGCCAQTVDGDGDQGPPTGWCYEGPHTMDKQEACYRQDGTEEDDKLGDCVKLRCGQQPRKPKRKRASSVDGDSNEDVPISALEPRERHGRRKSEGGRKSAMDLELLTDEDVDMEDATPEKKKPKPKTAPKKKKPEVAEETKEEREPSVTSATKAKGKATASGKAAGKKGAEESGTEAAAKKVTKKRKTNDWIVE